MSSLEPRLVTNIILPINGMEMSRVLLLPKGKICPFYDAFRCTS